MMLELKKIETKPRSKAKRRSTHSKMTDDGKELSYSRVISNFRLSDWAKRFCVKTRLFKTPGRTTFTDNNGVKRYTDNWQEVGDEENGDVDNWEQFFFQTGCLQFSQLFEIYGSLQNESEAKEEHQSSDQLSLKASPALNSIAYISEWQRLWIHLENDPKDELAQYAPFFRILIEFLFHPRMQQFMTALIIYNTVLTVVLMVIYASVVDYGDIFNLFFICFLDPVVYFGLVILYKGKVSEVSAKNSIPAPFRYTENQLPVEKLEVSDFPDSRPLDLSTFSQTTNVNNHFAAVRNELWSRIKQEIYLICLPITCRWSSTDPIQSSSSSSQSWYCFCCRESSQMLKWRQYHQRKTEMLRRYQQEKRKLSYHELLNISLKFLTRVNGIDPNKINFDRWWYRLILLFITVIFPVYLFFGQYFGGLLIFNLEACKDGSFSSELCTYYTIAAITSGGLMTRYFVQLIFAMSIMTALVSLGYGAEIAYRLADYWMVKFKSLRRVEQFDIEELLLNPDEIKIQKSPKQQLRKKKSIGTQEKAVDEEEERRSETVSVLHNNVKTISGKREHELVDADDIIADEVTPLIPPTINLDEENEISHHPLFHWVKRDAIEHYFFICEVFTAADKIWSPALTAIFLVGVVNCVVYVTVLGVNSSALDNNLILSLIIYLSVRFIVLFVYPILSLCHANAYIYELSNCFQKSSKDDFQLMGGSEEWVEFMTNCPAAWTFHGLWITWDRLFGLMWTCGAAGIASAAATISAWL
jgi:hypothetical protein